jgi:hypothetical protein
MSKCTHKDLKAISKILFNIALAIKIRGCKLQIKKTQTNHGSKRTNV